MPSNYTEQYSLNQWSKTDRVLMEDFNADNAKLDAALKAEADARIAADQAETAVRAAAVQSINTTLSGMVKLAAGHYDGDSAASRFISTGFTPKAVLVFLKNGYTYYGSAAFGGLAVTGYPAGGSNPAVQIADGGFYVFARTNAATNQTNDSYNYLALG